jgi:hypothetical protein
MSGMITSVLGFEMAAVVIGVGGCAVSVVTKKTAARTDRQNHKATVRTLRRGQPRRASEKASTDERDNFKLTDQVMTIRKVHVQWCPL